MSNAHDVIAVKINVVQIDKSRLFEGKGGKKYLDLILMPSPDSKYGDSHFVSQSVSKEERANGVRLPILGNAKILKSGGGGSAQQRRPEPTERQMANQDDEGGDEKDPLPF